MLENSTVVLLSSIIRFENSTIEIYSPKSVTGIGESMGLISGMALDLTANDVDGLPWDFNNPAKRERARELAKSKRALLLIGSPMCSALVSYRISISPR